jgi:uncharacterized protein YgfB (UPF0149 family)
MTSDVKVDYDTLDQLVVRMEMGTDVSELHGSLCGFISGGGRFGGQSVLPVLQLEAGNAPTQDDLSLLSRLRRETEEALMDPEFRFQPLLPDDDAPLTERADALVEWCRGFLGGLGLAGSRGHGELSEEAREVLRDLGVIASSQLDTGEADEDEASFVEVLEFVRVGALLLHAELTASEPPASDTLH